jgi:hypothetical protein
MAKIKRKTEQISIYKTLHIFFFKSNRKIIKIGTIEKSWIDAKQQSLTHSIKDDLVLWNTIVDIKISAHEAFPEWPSSSTL